MARLGRGVPARQGISRTRVASFDAALSLGAFETPFRYPRDQPVALGAFTTPFVYPPITVTAPHVPGSLITADGEIEFDAFLMSPQNMYRPQDDLEGWDDLPGVDNGDEERPSRSGAYPGEQILQERIVSATIQMRDDSPTFAANLRAIRAVTKPDQDGTEHPLVIRTRGETLIAYGKVVKRIPKTDYGIGLANISVQWVCSDPRRYGTAFYAETILTTSTVTNSGDEYTSPRYRLYGPVDVPRLTVAGRTLAFAVSLGTGQQLDVDTHTGDTIISGGGPTTSYAPLDAFSVPVEDFILPPGSHAVTYSPDAGGGLGASVFWRDAYS